MAIDWGIFAGAMFDKISEVDQKREEFRNDLIQKGLDIGINEWSKERSRVRKQAEEIKENMAALSLTGLDRVTRFKIAQGGSTSVNQALSLYETAAERGKLDSFRNMYSVAGSEQFEGMSDKDLVGKFLQEPEYDPEMATQYLKGRGQEPTLIEGLFGVEKKDLQADLESDFKSISEEQFGVGKTKPSSVPEIGDLSIDYGVSGDILYDPDRSGGKKEKKVEPTATYVKNTFESRLGGSLSEAGYQYDPKSGKISRSVSEGDASIPQEIKPSDPQYAEAKRIVGNTMLDVAQGMDQELGDFYSFKRFKMYDFEDYLKPFKPSFNPGNFVPQ